ncbi:MAG: hypothetical protein ACE5J2_05500 [Nitrososphaerales archaeon]
MNPTLNYKFGIMILPILAVMLLTLHSASAHHVDDRFGILISIVPQRYNFDYGETVLITGEVHALRSGSPLLLKVFNPKNSACSFDQLPLDKDMKFKAQPVKLTGAFCGIEGEYKITAHYGKGKALMKFNLAVSQDELSGGKAEVINAKILSDFLKDDNKYPVDLDLTSNAVFIRNNMKQTIAFYLMLAEFDAYENTKHISWKEVTLKPFEKHYIVPTFVPRMIDGKPNGYLHVFAWTELENPTPLHPGLYIPY